MSIRAYDDWRAEARFQHWLFRRAVKDKRTLDATIAAREVERCFTQANRAFFDEMGGRP